MLFGVAIFPTDYSISMSELAPAAEDAGFESRWVAEHSHIPTSRRSPWPGGAELPKQYRYTFDPFHALTVAALASKTIKVATGICLVVQRDPIHTAKEVSTLDVLSGGRFLFGVGGGWNREELEDHGAHPAKRWQLRRERVEAMKEIWTHDVAEYHGEMVDFGPMWQWPKPRQKPHPPVILGGSGPKIVDRVVRYADGWMPNRGEVVERLPELREKAAAAGRGRIPVSCYPQPGREDIERLAAAGVERCIYYVPPDGRDQALARLEELAEMVRPYLKT